MLLGFKQRKKRYNPSETSHDEETMEQEEAESQDKEPHPPNNSKNDASFVRLSLSHKALETVSFPFATGRRCFQSLILHE